jgi:hypothetical protein
MTFQMGRWTRIYVDESLDSPAFHDYVQYESVVHFHDSVDAQWSYSGTNGFRSEMRASG